MDNLFSVIIFIAFYVYFSYSLQVIADKTNTEDSWMAWVPIVNLYLLCRISGKPGCVGILWVIPVVGVIIPGYLAFTD